MVRLNTSDASVLARIAQYNKLPSTRVVELLNELQGEQAQEIGSIITGKRNRGSTNDIDRAAERIRTWARRNRTRRTLRPQPAGQDR